MSLWNRIIESISGADGRANVAKKSFYDSSRYAFIDVEVGTKDHKIHDIGALRWDGAVFHSANKKELFDFLNGVDFLCGHNIIHHDAKYLFGTDICQCMFVDTLYVSPLLFPERPYHRLLKDDKLVSEQMNNPVNDCEKAKDLLMDEVACWEALSEEKKTIFATLLQEVPEFEGFMEFVKAKAGKREKLADLIRSEYHSRICAHANIENIITHYPCELAYALALIDKQTIAR